MFVKHLTLSHFRNHKNTEISFERGVNLLVGPNGQGKTNVVEAIEYVSTLTSHRVAGYQPLINKESNQAIIRLKVSHETRDVLVDLELNRDNPNQLRINQSPIPRMRDVLGTVYSVVFAPEDIDIVKRDPSNRRSFIDQLLVQFSPRMAGVISDYERVLKQRNTLLKTARNTGAKGSSLSTLDAWDESLIKFGSEIIQSRLTLIHQIKPLLTEAYQAIAISNNEPSILMKSSLLGSAVVDDFEEAELEYLTLDELQKVPEIYREKLSTVRSKELERGITLIGPHRDDLVLMLGDLPAKGYASHGESWSYALALRLASAKLLSAESKTGDPVVILDDVFAELDSGRRDRLASLVAGNEQVIITAAVAEDVPESLKATVFNVKESVVTRV
ncbi:MAG: DNA replication/repair protein RecF [Micrococcales bacterium]